MPLTGDLKESVSAALQRTSPEKSDGGLRYVIPARIAGAVRRTLEGQGGVSRSVACGEGQPSCTQRAKRAASNLKRIKLAGTGFLSVEDREKGGGRESQCRIFDEGLVGGNGVLWGVADAGHGDVNRSSDLLGIPCAALPLVIDTLIATSEVYARHIGRALPMQRRPRCRK